VMHLALARINSPPVRSRALRTLGNVMKDNSENRNAFIAKVVDSEDGGQKQPALHRLLVILLNSRNISERLGSLYAFKSYLHENEEGQIALASTLRPSPLGEENEDSVDSFSIGRRLLHGLLIEGAFNGDGLSGWFAGCVLSYILTDSPTCKKLALEIPLEIPRGDQPIMTLLAKIGQAVVDVATSKGDTLVLIALLRLLGTWVDDCSPAVKALLNNPKNLPFWVEMVVQENGNVHVQGLVALLVGLCFQVDDNKGDSEGASSTFNRSSLHLIITRDIGTAKFMGRLDAIRKSEAFLFAEQDKPVIITEEEGDISNRERLLDAVLYDYDFTIFFKDAYDRILRKIRSPHATPSKTSSLGRIKSGQDSGGSGAGRNGNQQYEAVLQSYKDLIRNQDQEMTLLKKQILELQQDRQKSIALKPTATSNGVDGTRSLSFSPGSPLPGYAKGFPNLGNQDAQLAQFQARIAELENLLKEKTGEVDSLTQMVNSQRQELLAAQTTAHELNSLAQAYNGLEDVLRAKEAEIDFLKQQQAGATGERSTSQDRSREQEEEISSLMKRNQELEAQVHQHRQQQQGYQQQIEQLQQKLQQRVGSESGAASSGVMQEFEAKIEKLQNDLRDEKMRYEGLEEEQEELLITLAKVEIENNNLKERLAQFEPV